MSLKEQLSRIVENWDKIPIRAQVDGKWGSHYLSELPDETIADWIAFWVKDRFTVHVVTFSNSGEIPT